MSLADKNPHGLERIVSKASRAAKARRLLFASCALLLTAVVVLSQRQRQPQGLLSLKADPPSITLCPGQPTKVRLTATHSASVRIEPDYSWKVDDGNIEAKGDSAVWDLAGVQPGSYTITVTASPLKPGIVAPLSIKSQVAVIVAACRDEAACPRISLGCPEVIYADTVTPFKVSWKGGRPDVTPSFSWHSSGGGIRNGQGTPEIALDTNGFTDSSIVLKVYVLGYGRPCSQECKMAVRQSSNTKPTVTPTETPTPTPTSTSSPSPTATPSPSPFVILNASPEASPTLTPSPSGTPNVQSSWSKWLWQIPTAILALCAAAFLAARMFLFGGASASKSGPDSSDKDLKGESSGSLESGGVLGGLVGGKKKADKVQCTVYAPEQAAPGDPFQVQVFAHLAKQAGELAALAAKADAEARDRGSHALSEPIERGTKITFALKMDGLKVNGRKKSLVWDGTVNFVQFAVDVPEDFLPDGVDEKQVRGEVKIYYGEENAPVGEIMFLFKVVREGATLPEAAAPTRPEQRHHVYEYAFVSYCSDDLEKVLLGLRGMVRRWEQEGISYFFDRRNIKPGEEWRTAIGKHLDKCDLFVLFWSKAAQDSKEVGKEISYALARKGGSNDNPPAFDPFAIEKPIPMPLPSGLETYHFGDELLNYMQGGGKQRAE